MKAFLKRMVHWDGRGESEQRAFLQRFDFWRYRAFWAVSPIVCLLPIPAWMLLRLCLSDKDQPGEHRYGPTYSSLFWHFKYRRIALLEIGIGGYKDRIGGESLNAWQMYFPFARLVGADIQDKRRLATPSTRIYQLDQSSEQQLNALCEAHGPFDIVIDDGSHMNSHQILTFRKLFKSVRPGGLYIIEDVQTSYWSDGGWDGAQPDSECFEGTCMGYFLQLAKYVNYQEFRHGNAPDPGRLAFAKSVRNITFEHNLIVVRKARSSL
jgi:hypothetical protein